MIDGSEQLAILPPPPQRVWKIVRVLNFSGGGAVGGGGAGRELNEKLMKPKT